MARPLTPKERDLIAYILGLSSSSHGHFDLVEDMNDGGMGSIRFLSSEDQISRTAQVIAQGEYVDEDGVVVSVVVNADQNGELFEVDFWKVDFSPLKRYPKASDIKIDAITAD